MKNVFAFLAVVMLLAGSFFTAAQTHAVTTAIPSPGSLVRGQSFTAVYYIGADGFRYVFPTEKTYFTWYSDFSKVQWITDTQLGKIQIGGNVTYKPGVKMIKIDSDPRTYAVSAGGELHHVASESLATQLYGSAWNTKIDDVPDGFFSNYTISDPIESATDYSAASATSSVEDIDDDKGLASFTVVYLTDNGIETENGASDAEINEGETILFVNTGAEKHSATAEDGSWGTGTLLAGEMFVKRFTESGEYDYFDTYFNENTATITVN